MLHKIQFALNIDTHSHSLKEKAIADLDIYVDISSKELVRIFEYAQK